MALRKRRRSKLRGMYPQGINADRAEGVDDESMGSDRRKARPSSFTNDERAFLAAEVTL